MKRLIQLLLFVSLPVLGIGQNLIPNGDFEDRSRSGSAVWVQPEGPNYHWDSSGFYGEPHEGHFYNGICISNFEYSEALSVSLTRPLQAGEEYHIGLYIRQFPGTQGTYNHLLAKEMQVYFSANRPPPKPRRLYPVDSKRLIRIPLPPDSQRADYEFVEATYIAHGGETFMTLGYFATDDPSVPVIPDCASVTAKPLNVPCPDSKDNPISYPYKKERKRKQDHANLDPIQQQMQKGVLAYRTRFYIDNLCLAPLHEDGSFDCGFENAPIVREEPVQPEKPVTGEVYVIERIYFEFDSTRLLPESFPALDSLVEVLTLYPDLDIRIQGHTDSMGTDAYNQVLSEGRARAVYRYLVNQHIDETRLTFKGYGESIPIASNSTPEGRQRNRRVEFKVLETNP